MIVDSGFWGDIRFDPDDIAPNYIGMHLENDALTTNREWKIYKVTQGDTGITRFQLAYGAWDSREDLF